MDANEREAERWFRQGEKDLRSSKNSHSSGDYEWACFQAQQSSEKVLKALLYARGFRRILTHSIFELIIEIGIFANEIMALKTEAKLLDSVYITSRYPDSIVGNLTPSEYFEEEDAIQCIRSAELIYGIAKKLLYG
ncbi:DNA-binding protein [Methanocalculus chunghsingensis]|uniref:DNA-binding protein n=1 Tax=Methanocalculus chunghsingensis TaxID=156457 RepID=A0A8J7WAL2_9EURY|nr:HEPN domain-containing protein [Methanocalculus chunghsingensis]MBR1369437.1 DNA-binding protein [Methanocalculus chunghsingensis]